MNKKILALALPSIAANVTTPLLGMVDTAITGHMGSSVYIAAIAVGGVMFNMLYWLFGFLRAGTSGLSAQAYGADDMTHATLVLYRSIFVGAAVGIAMIALRQPLAELLVNIVKPDAVTEPLARKYFSILIWGAPATLCTYALSGWFLGMQNSRMNLWCSLIINLVNICASLLLVLVLRWKVGGVASGTLIAQWTGLAAGVWFLRRFRTGRVTLEEILRWKEIQRFFKINGYIMIRTVFLILTTVWFTRAGAMQGSVVLAVNTMLMQLFMFFSFVMDGFAFAGEALVGMYAGEGNRKEERNVLHHLFRWGWILSLSFTLIYFLGGEWFLGILCNDHEVIRASEEYWWWAIAVPIAGFSGFVWDGVYVGATMGKEMMVTMAEGAAVFFISYFLLYPVLGNHGLWIAFLLYLLTRGVSQWYLYKKRK